MVSKVAELVVGTAQLGMPYGAANANGMPSEVAAIDLVRRAISLGVHYFDTARAYGDAERRLGLAIKPYSADALTVMTKLDPLSELAPNCEPEVARSAVRRSLAASREALGQERLSVVLLHRAAHRLAWGGAAWRELRAQKEAGTIERVGVSAAAPNEALEALADPEVKHVQLPFNVLDYRWEATGVIEAARRRPEVTIHARSVLMQGLLSGAWHGRWPVVGGVSPAAVLDELRRWTTRLGRESLADLCFSYVKGQDWIDGIVIGMETQNQLAANIALFNNPPLAPTAAALIRVEMPHLPMAFLDIPAWPGARQYPNGEPCP